MNNSLGLQQWLRPNAFIKEITIRSNEQAVTEEVNIHLLILVVLQTTVSKRRSFTENCSIASKYKELLESLQVGRGKNMHLI